MVVTTTSNRTIKCRTKFGEWLAYNIYYNRLTIKELANRLRLSRAIVNQHVNGTAKPTFAGVIAYCYIFERMSDITFDPEIIYEMVNEEL